MTVVVRSTASFNTQPPEGGWGVKQEDISYTYVSTHSRLKAAGQPIISINFAIKSFNTQPPEGGWVV